MCNNFGNDTGNVTGIIFEKLPILLCLQKNAL